MYSWGSSDPSSWKKGGYDYGIARDYLDNIGKASAAKGRSYVPRDSPDMDMVDPKNKIITSNSENPIIIATDVTGSMASWPAEIFDRLPLIYQTLVQYKPDVELSFAAIGDATCDRYPLQVNGFGKALKLEDQVNALYPEGAGGGQSQESYELFGFYALNNVETPKADMPFLFIFGDEGFYKNVDPGQVSHYIGGRPNQDLDSKTMWAMLQNKFNVYLIHKPYGSGAEDSAIVRQWKSALGDERVVTALGADRVVDQALGIIAKAWGHYDDFSTNMSARHGPKIVDAVWTSIRHVDPYDANATKSVLKLPSGSIRSKSLLDGK